MIPVVDAHHHLWDLTAVRYPWLEAQGVRRFFGDPTPIQRNYLATNFTADAVGIGLSASVHVQVGAADPLAETHWLHHHAQHWGWPHAIVAFADLTSASIEATLDAHRAAAPQRLRGIRQIVSRHPSEDEGHPDLLADPRFLEGLRLLAARGLSFDLQLSAPLLVRAAEVFAAVPGLPVALCHVGSPWDLSPSGLKTWREGLSVFAEAAPNAVVKLSGFAMFAPDWTEATLQPLIETALDIFGAERALWGSNFPVDGLYRSYRETFAAVRAAVPAAMQAEVFAGTARRFYRL